MDMRVVLDRKGQVKQTFIFLLSDGFSMLSLSNLIEQFSLLNQVEGEGQYRWVCVSETGGTETNSCGPEIAATKLPKVVHFCNCLITCDGLNRAGFYRKAVANWLRQHAAHGGVVGSLENGGYELTQAGSLKNKRFSAHWKSQQDLAESYSSLEALDKVCEADRKLLTCAGAEAASDLMHNLIALDFNGATPNKIAETCEHPGQRISNDTQGAPLSAILDTRNIILIDAVRTLQNNNESLAQMAEAQYVSGHQLERVSRKVLSTSSGQFYKELHLTYADRPLCETDLPASEIALARGDNSQSVFGRRFRTLFGDGPTESRDWLRSTHTRNKNNQQKEKTS